MYRNCSGLTNTLHLVALTFEVYTTDLYTAEVHGVIAAAQSTIKVARSSLKVVSVTAKYLPLEPGGHAREIYFVVVPFDKSDIA